MYSLLSSTICLLLNSWGFCDQNSTPSLEHSLKTSKEAHPHVTLLPILKRKLQNAGNCEFEQVIPDFETPSQGLLFHEDLLSTAIRTGNRVYKERLLPQSMWAKPFLMDGRRPWADFDALLCGTKEGGAPLPRWWTPMVG